MQRGRCVLMILGIPSGCSRAHWTLSLMILCCIWPIGVEVSNSWRLSTHMSRKGERPHR